MILLIVISLTTASTRMGRSSVCAGSLGHVQPHLIHPVCYDLSHLPRERDKYVGKGDGHL